MGGPHHRRAQGGRTRRATGIRAIASDVGAVAAYEAATASQGHLGRVGYLGDLIGTNHARQAAADQRPYLLKWDRPVLWLWEVSGHELTTDAALDLTAGFSVYVAGRLTAPAGAGALLASEDSDGLNTVLSLAIAAGPGAYEAESNTDGTPASLSAVASEHRVRVGRDFSVCYHVSAAAVAEVTARGVTLTSTPAGVGSYLPASARKLRIGLSSADALEGLLYGVWVLEAGATAAQRATLEEYVAARLPDYARDAALLNAPDVSVPMQDSAAPIASPTGHTVTPSGSLTYGADCPAIGAPLALGFSSDVSYVDITTTAVPGTGDWHLGWYGRTGTLATDVWWRLLTAGGNCYMYTTALGEVRIVLTDSASNSVSGGTATGVVVADTYYQFDVDIDRGLDQCRISLDGLLVLTVDISSLVDITPVPSGVRIGSQASGINGCRIAAVSVFGSYLSTAEIRARYRLAMGNLYTDAIEPLSPVHAWEVDPDGVVTALAGTAALTLTAAATPGSKTPMGCGVPWAVDGDGTDAIATVTDADLDVDFDNFSAVLFFHTTSAAQLGIMGKYLTAPASWDLYAESGALRFRVNGSTSILSARYSDDSWRMVYISLADLTKTLSVYHASGVSTVASAVVGTVENSAGMAVGANNVSGGAKFTGSLTPPMIFDRALSDLELRSIWLRFCAGDGLTYLPLTGGSLVLSGGDNLVTDGADNIIWT